MDDPAGGSFIVSRARRFDVCFARFPDGLSIQTLQFGFDGGVARAALFRRARPFLGRIDIWHPAIISRKREGEQACARVRVLSVGKTSL